jgi:voltage-gated potassium channel
MTTSRLAWLADRLEGPIGLVALLVVPALLLEERGTTPELRQAAVVLNWVIWIVFCAGFLVRLAAAPTWETVRAAWFELLLIVISPPFLVPDYLQATRALRILRLLRLMRTGVVAGVGVKLTRSLFTRRKFHYVLLVTSAIVVAGAIGIFVLEGQVNPGVHNFSDAVWWSTITVATVGSADTPPHTFEGRMITLVLILTGICVIDVFTAVLVSAFLDMDQRDDAEALEARLGTIEAKLDRLLAERPHDAPAPPGPAS